MFYRLLMLYSTAGAVSLASQILPSPGVPTTISTQKIPVAAPASAAAAAPAVPVAVAASSVANAAHSPPPAANAAPSIPPAAHAAPSLPPAANAAGPSLPLNAPSGASAMPANKPSQAPTPKVDNMTIPDDGWEYGNIIIHNWCSQTLYVQSVGAHYLGGWRDGATAGWGTPDDAAFHEIPSKGLFTEPFRGSGGCSYTGPPPYCPEEDKLAGQAISLKISKTNNPGDTNITQMEYALYQDPKTGDKFKRLYYDVSLLDCANPNAMAPEGKAEKITDFNATPEMHARKLALCPGYDGGVSVTFSGDEKGAICPPIYCDGVQKCFMMYTFDRTRPQESSFTCGKEYRGDLRLDLCAKDGDDKVKEAAEGFSAWAQTATHEVLMLQLGKTAKVEVGPPTGKVLPVSHPVASATLQAGGRSVVAGSNSVGAGGNSVMAATPAHPTASV